MIAEGFMDKQKLEFLNAKSDEIRKILIEMIGRLGVGHVGGSLSVVDLLTVLYYDLAKVDPGLHLLAHDSLGLGKAADFAGRIVSSQEAIGS